jgi:hypothetical protein
MGFREAQTGFPAIAATLPLLAKRGEAALGDRCALSPCGPSLRFAVSPAVYFLKRSPSFDFLFARLSLTLGSRPKQSRLGYG